MCRFVAGGGPAVTVPTPFKYISCVGSYDEAENDPYIDIEFKYISCVGS